MLVPTYKLKNVVACACACVGLSACVGVHWHMCVGVRVLECVPGVVL